VLKIEKEGAAISSEISTPEIGSPGRTRTCDHSVNSRTLYQLSYRGTRVLKRWCPKYWKVDCS
jgi:hypothetical protein